MHGRISCAVWILVMAVASTVLWGQSFHSGSTGTDGALAYPNAKPGDVIVFNPSDPSQFPSGVDPAHDNIFNFTTITIPQGVTVKLTAQVLGGPIYWLASGAVDIEGTLDLSGAPGYPPTSLISQRIQAIPGPGGFPGGVGGSGAAGSSDPSELGQGPGGGGFCYTSNAMGGSGSFTANQFLVPLIGGSGGAGEYYTGGFGAGGGAGGGAILIASTVSITINGVITAAGGNAGHLYAGPGAGGAIHLMAPSIQGGGAINVAGGSYLGGGYITGQYGCQGPQSGLARLEAFQQQFSGSLSGTQTSGSPFNTFVPGSGATPKITVASVNGVPVSPNPLGNFTNPDVTFSSSSPVPVVVNGQNIPAGTQVNLQIYSENGPDIVLPNAGSLATTSGSSTSVTVMVNLPPGFSRGFISATFTPTTTSQTTSTQTVKRKQN